jgi:hypothetical protein
MHGIQTLFVDRGRWVLTCRCKTEISGAGTVHDALKGMNDHLGVNLRAAQRAIVRQGR